MANRSNNNFLLIAGALLLAAALAGCANTGSDAKDASDQPAVSAASTAENEVEPRRISGIANELLPPSPIETYWKEFAPKIAMKQDLYQEFEERPLDDYVEGLRNADPVIRWYCAYKITDYADRLSDSDRQAVTALMNDEDADVVKAATFADGILTGGDAGGAIARTSDGKTSAYYKYREARFNDGKVYLVRDGQAPEVIFDDPSVIDVKFSPSDRHLLVGNGGRIWQVIHVYDLKTGEWLKLPSLIDALFAAPDSDPGLDPKLVDPTYQWVRAQEWSPEGERFLYSYHFSVEGNDYDGYAVFDMKKNAVVRTMPSAPDSDPLTAFSWEA